MEEIIGRKHILSMPLSHMNDKDRLYAWITNLMTAIGEDVENYWVEIKIHPQKKEKDDDTG